ncbi:hypothetical protein HK105_207434 [Polyrhizophydium stewartii]|uniref:Glutamine amidotransferase type-2 domain-containing protein n=1 Tax=Polyrhizophydium stewartii TaxID=2732419 RepID=A0ABR4N0P4_9FUNG
MCGILLALAAVREGGPPEHGGLRMHEDLLQRLRAANAMRGPDAHGYSAWVAGGVAAEMHGWVLHLRGTAVSPQPVTDARTGSILCFNGEVFGGLDVPPDVCDTDVVAAELAAAVCESDVLRAMSRIDGEWAFVYYHAPTNKIFFGRDHLGRRSLLVQLPQHEDDVLLVSSSPAVQQAAQGMDAPDANPGYWSEVTTAGIFVIDCASANERCWADHSSFMRLVPWSDQDGVADLTCPSLVLNSALPSVDDLAVLDPDSGASPEIPKFAADSPLAKAAGELLFSLQDSVRRRTENIPNHPISMHEAGSDSSPLLARPARLGVLFSGGLDCITLAALAHRYLPPDEPVDLLNVGFENPRVLGSHARQTSARKPNRHVAGAPNEGPALEAGAASREAPDEYDVPDRITGRLGASELARLFPSRQWRFVEINVPYAEAIAQRDMIKRLMMPLDTVMDLSIAMAFWFASRGRGVVRLSPPDRSSAVPFLGGYGRHRVQFVKQGWQGLISELQLDVSRISTRNLGRDDRIVSSHGKEVRFPFLDSGVTRLLCRMPVHLKTDPRLAKGVGDKLVLRLVASALGLTRAALEPKRAVQFGARTAKMETSKQRGQDLAGE